MTRIQTLLIIFILGLSTLISCQRVEKKAKPNIVYILTDQWRASALGYSGDPNVKTPNLDRFAAEAVNFPNAVTVCPVCTPYRAPFIAWWPGNIRAGAVSDHISAFWDVLPTMAELTHQPMPVQASGISFLPELLGHNEQQEKAPFMYWEFCRGPDQNIWSQALRFGDWKYVKITGGLDEPVVELYNLAEDLGEEQDLASRHPEVLQKAEKIIEETRIPVNEVR